MGDHTKIEWTDRTFNPWWGCHRISPACRNCYADQTAQRWGHDVFHHRGPRRMLSDQNWRKPLSWNRDAQRTGIPIRVFTASMADVFEDHPQVTDARQRLWQLIEDTPWLRWQLLTKRPENIASMAPWQEAWPDHVWIGASAEDQRRADERIPHILKTSARVKFLSCEPLLDRVDLTAYLAGGRTLQPDGVGSHSAPSAMPAPAGTQSAARTPITWVIAGGESGPRARPTHPDWLRFLRDQCHTTGTAFFFKQWGEWAPSGRIAIGGPQDTRRTLIGDPLDDLGNRTEMHRPGKKRAGRLLDGELHDTSPPLTPPPHPPTS